MNLRTTGSASRRCLHRLQPSQVTRTSHQHPGVEGKLAKRVVFASASAKDTEDELENKTSFTNPDSEAFKKQQRVEELRAQEKWMKVGTGEADCLSCGFHFDPKKGDPEYPVGPGTDFQDLPSDWMCPVCGAAKNTFQVQEKEIAGFAVNQGYGFGTNSMTEGQKSILIYGSLLFFFVLFLLGYFLN